MIIAQISDTHIETARPEAASRIADLARTVAAIEALEPYPDVVLFTGDIAHDATAEDYRVARAAIARLRAPVLATIGNRDRRGPFREAFACDGYLEPGHDYAQYAVDLGGIRFVAVDTHDPNSPLGSFCPDRDVHLDRLLRAGGPGRPTIVFLHHPPVAIDLYKGPELQFKDAAQANRLAEMIGTTEGVISVLAGHVHRSKTAAVRGVPLSTMPAVAADLTWEGSGQRRLNRPVFHLHKVRGGEISTASVVVHGA